MTEKYEIRFEFSHEVQPKPWNTFDEGEAFSPADNGHEVFVRAGDGAVLVRCYNGTRTLRVVSHTELECDPRVSRCVPVQGEINLTLNKKGTE